MMNIRAEIRKSSTFDQTSQKDRSAAASPVKIANTPATLKRLILCLDGTWNSDESRHITNIVRLRDLIDPKYAESGKAIAQRVYYDTGVGTGLSLTDEFIGGATGAGLEENVRQAYRFLSAFYKPGIEIFIFGFSRGAFTARSIAGYIGSSGLLMPEHCTAANEQRAWDFYRTPPGNRFPSDQLALAKLCFPDVRIKCLGVFDTVGARGIPTELTRNWNRRKYGFHDVTLGSNVDYAFHALAIDEKRGPFGASVWQYPLHKNNLGVEQVWFPGVHANIGGGYPDTSISDLSLQWMLSRIERYNLGLGLLPGWEASFVPADPRASDSRALGKVYESRGMFYAWDRWHPKIRVINQSAENFPAGCRLSRLAPRAIPVGERLHWSALYRWTEYLTKKSIAPYEPPNLVAALDAALDDNNPKRLPIVGRSGNALNWYENADDEKEFMSLLPPAYQDKAATALKTWRARGIEMSTFLDPARQSSAPLGVKFASQECKL